MAVQRSVINASPLIFLSRGNHLDLVHHLTERLLVPRPVADEILARGPADPTAKVLSTIDWIEVVSVDSIPEVVMQWGLGPGESAVLAYAYANPGTECIIDDLSGRKCAHGLSIRVRGTLGIVLDAKRKGLVPRARPVMEDLIRAGLYLSRDVLDKALGMVGE